MEWFVSVSGVSHQASEVYGTSASDIFLFVCIYIYIYIYIERERERERASLHINAHVAILAQGGSCIAHYTNPQADL